MQVFASSDKGKVRETNQDNYYISNPNDEILLFILADGMGGYNGGEIASKLAVDAVKNYITSNYNNTNMQNREDVLELIRSAIEYSNMVVYEKAQKEEELHEMGTTLEVCLIYNNKVFIGHVGDSRVYRIRKQIIRKLTTDHSFVEKLIKEGTITREESYHHPKKNMLMKAVGTEANIEPDIFVKGYIKDDIILICSDGLTNMISENEIYNIIKSNIHMPTQTLIQEANALGGYDNISSIVIYKE